MINDKHGIPQPELTGTKAFHVECVRCFKTGTGGKPIEYYKDEKGNDDLSKPPKVVTDGELLGYKISILDDRGFVKYQLPYFRFDQPYESPKVAWDSFICQSPVKAYEADKVSELVDNPFIGTNFKWS